MSQIYVINTIERRNNSLCNTIMKNKKKTYKPTLVLTIPFFLLVLVFCTTQLVEENINLQPRLKASFEMEIKFKKKM